ncbi:MAG: Nramp family divalent metal transporter, partial [Bacteroidia bacterium]|nr:Nramp family divalent metal transporter [Bacteroidia bacterium]
DGNALYIAIGIIGATVMPHNLYLHSALVQTRKFGKEPLGLKKAIKFNFIDSAIALNLAFFVNAAILILAAAAFHKYGYNQIADIQDAHKLLTGIFGTMAPALFAIALIAAGQSSTITGTLAGQIVMEGYLNLRISPWLRRIITRSIAIIPAVFVILYFGEEKIGELLILSQVVLSLQLGFAVIPLIHFNSSKKIMGDFAISTLVKILAWVAASLIVVLNIKLIIEELNSFFNTPIGGLFLVKFIVFAVVAYALFLLVYITLEPLIERVRINKSFIPHGHAIDFNEVIKPHYNSVALAVDFSIQDNNILHHALSLGGLNAKYLLIHVVESAGALHTGKDILDKEAEFDLANLMVYQDNLQNKGYRVDIKLGFGKSANTLSEIINKTDADILVMGAHGHKGIKDFIFGSTIDKVRHQVKIPVLIIK